jgi:hypothetical protein
VPLAAPLTDAAEAHRIGRSWTRVRVPGHWQLGGAFAAYEGLVLYRCRFGYRVSTGDDMVSLRFGGVYYSRYAARSRRSTPGETSCGKSTIVHVVSGSTNATPRVMAALARLWPLPKALERIRTSALCSCSGTDEL